jgi:threonine dehydratase
LTIPIILRFVDDFILVSEMELRQAIAFAWWNYGETIEGSAAVALAAALSGKIGERPLVIIITGGNIEPGIMREILEKYPSSALNWGKP